MVVTAHKGPDCEQINNSRTISFATPSLCCLPFLLFLHLFLFSPTSVDSIFWATSWVLWTNLPQPIWPSLPLGNTQSQNFSFVLQIMILRFPFLVAPIDINTRRTKVTWMSWKWLRTLYYSLFLGEKKLNLIVKWKSPFLLSFRLYGQRGSRWEDSSEIALLGTSLDSFGHRKKSHCGHVGSPKGTDSPKTQK